MLVVWLFSRKHCCSGFAFLTKNTFKLAEIHNLFCNMMMMMSIIIMISIYLFIYFWKATTKKTCFSGEFASKASSFFLHCGVRKRKDEPAVWRGESNQSVSAQAPVQWRLNWDGASGVALTLLACAIILPCLPGEQRGGSSYCDHGQCESLRSPVVRRAGASIPARQIN